MDGSCGAVQWEVVLRELMLGLENWSGSYAAFGVIVHSMDVSSVKRRRALLVRFRLGLLCRLWLYSYGLAQCLLE